MQHTHRIDINCEKHIEKQNTKTFQNFNQHSAWYPSNCRINRSFDRQHFKYTRIASHRIASQSHVLQPAVVWQCAHCDNYLRCEKSDQTHNSMGARLRSVEGTRTHMRYPADSYYTRDETIGLIINKSAANSAFSRVQCVRCAPVWFVCVQSVTISN